MTLSGNIVRTAANTGAGGSAPYIRTVHGTEGHLPIIRRVHLLYDIAIEDQSSAAQRSAVG